MFRLALRTLRFRIGGFAASFIALFFGVLIVTACGGLMETGIRTEVPPKRLAGAPLVVAGDQSYTLPKSGDTERVTLPERVRLSADLVPVVRAVPGVATTVADVSFPVAVLGLGDSKPIEVDRPLTGHGWSSASLAPYTLTAGRAPDGAGEVVIDASVADRVGIRPGSTVELVVTGTADSFRVVGLVAGPAGLPAGVFFADPDAQRIAAGWIDVIGVFPAPGIGTDELRGRIEAALHGHPALQGGGVIVSTGVERGRAEFADVTPGGEILVVMSAVFGGLAIMVVVFVVASTLGLSVQQRRREMALLRIVGTTPGQLRRMVIGEATVLSVLAMALAQPLGARAGRALFDRLTEHGVAPPVIAFHQGWIPAAVGAGVGLITAIIAALIAARSAATARPADSLTATSLQDWRLGPLRLAFGLVSLAGAAALALVTAIVIPGEVAASTAGPAAMLWAAGLALLGPRIVPVVTALLHPAMRAVSGKAGHLALLNVRARRIRMAAAITPVMLATGLSTGLIYLQTSQTAEARRGFDDSLRADVVVTSSTGDISPDLIDAIRGTAGVATASALVTSTGYVETPRFESQSDDGLPLRGVSPEGAEATTAVSVTAGRLTDLRGDTIALETGHARHIGGGIGVDVGDTVTLRLGDRARADLRVVALFTMRAGPKAALLPAPLLAAHTTAGEPAMILVRAAPGVDSHQLAKALAGLADGRPGLRIADRSEATAAFAEREQTGAWVNYMFIGVIIGYSVISLVNTLIITASERRREFALQRLIGSHRGQVLRMMGVEGLVITIAGILLGAVVSTLTLVPFGIALNGSPIPSGPLWIYLAVVGSAAGLTVVATLLSTSFALHPRPATVAAGPV